MKERPILFSSPMVRALLAGKKTQTRRKLKQKPNDADVYMDTIEPGVQWPYGQMENGDFTPLSCPYGVPGDQLWCRETFFDATKLNEGRVLYRADGVASRFGWTASIFMPRHASRITLEITDVRIERLQEISEPDAQAEGITDSWPEIERNSDRPYRDGFRWLWESINGYESWKVNEWVWVISFKRITP